MREIYLFALLNLLKPLVLILNQLNKNKEKPNSLIFNFPFLFFYFSLCFKTMWITPYLAMAVRRLMC